MNAEKIVHWLAVTIIAILVLGVVCVIAALLYLLVLNGIEEWRAWLKFFGVVAILCGSAWAERYIQDHGWPWKSKQT